MAPKALAADLVWNAPDGCGPDVFVTKLEDTAEDTLANLRIRQITVTIVQVETSPERWQLALKLTDDAQTQAPERTIDGSNCSDVSRAAAVAVAMALQDQEPPPAVTPAPAPALPLMATSEAVSRTSANTDTRKTLVDDRQTRAWRLPFQVFGSIDGALQGVPSVGIGLGIGASWERLTMGVRGVYLPTTTLGEQVGMDVHSALGLVDACWDLTTSVVRPRVCLGYETGAIMGRGRGSGLRVSRPQTATWHAVKPEVGLVVALTENSYFGFSVTSAVALTRAKFVFDEGRVAHELPRVSVRGNAALGWNF